MNRLRAIRERMGLSRAEVARRARMSESGVRLLELGLASPRIETARALSAALGVSVEDIWPPEQHDATA